MGVTFLVFTPLPFVDASSAWALRNKWHRILVGASGMLAELAVAKHDYPEASRRYQALLDRHPNHREGKRQFEQFQKALLRENGQRPHPNGDQAKP